MKTSKILFKIAIYLLAGIVLTVILPFTVWAILHDSPDLADTLEANWQIVLADDAGWEEVYRADSGASFHGDGIRYHVIVYNDESKIINMADWTTHEGTTRWYNTYRESADAWLGDINVDVAQYPQYDDSVYYYQQKSDGSEIIMFWNADEDKVYVVQSFY